MSATNLAQVFELKEALEQRFPNAQPVAYRTGGVLVTGISALDNFLPAGGLPRGRLSLWTPGGGATAILYAAAQSVAERGERSAWIDGAGTIAGDSWKPAALLLKPEGELEALVCAEELLRSGGFGLVVLSGGGRAFTQEDVRLSRAVREGGGAFVALSATSSVAHLRITSRIAPEAYRWRQNPFGEPVEVVEVRVQVDAQAMGWSGHTSLSLPVMTHAYRSAPDPKLVDRRGANKKSTPPDPRQAAAR
jgi:hypothetical protein